LEGYGDGRGGNGTTGVIGGGSDYGHDVTAILTGLPESINTPAKLINYIQ
jgi:hypothetical protein